MFPTLTLNFDVVFIQFDDSFQDNLANDLASLENAAYKQLAEKKAKAKTVSKASAKVMKDQMPRRSSRSLPSARPHHHQASPGTAIVGYHQLRAHLVV